MSGSIDWTGKRVFVCSPLKARAGNTLPDNVALARRLCLLATRSGVAAFAPHVFYSGFLDDTVEADRQLGMKAGRAWLAAAHEVWVYDALGTSDGMQADIDFFKRVKSDYGHRVLTNLPCWIGMEPR